MKSIENFENLFFEMSKWCHWLWVSPHVRMEQKLSFPECKPPITNSEPGHNLFSLRLLSVLTVEYFVEQLLPGLVSSSHWLRNILTIIIIPPAACIAETAVWRQDLSFGPRNINLGEAMANGQCFHKNLTTNISEFSHNCDWELTNSLSLFNFCDDGCCIGICIFVSWQFSRLSRHKIAQT